MGGAVMETLTPVERWFGERGIDRDLLPHELAVLAEALAAEPALWRGLVCHDRLERVCVHLYRDRHVDAWLLCWAAAQDTGLHDHDVSSGAVRVVDGVIAEGRLLLSRRKLATARFRAGEAFTFDASRIHLVRHSGAAPATSLHLYSPPLWRMGYYEVDEQGRLSR